MFSYPMSLTVGDHSTNYQKDRRPAEQIGKLKNFTNNRGKSTCSETFGRLESNAIGDEYQDVGKYFLRTEKKPQAKSIFKPSGGHKLTKHSEFVHQKEYDEHHAGPKNIPINFMARSTSEGF